LIVAVEGAGFHGQLPPFGIACAFESPAHKRSHVALVQLTEQEPVQVMWHVELPLHETLPLGPTVVVHVEFPVHARLQELPHDPLQLVWFSHASVQLPPSPPHIAALNPQVIPELHEHVAPVQTGAGAEAEPPHAINATRHDMSRGRMSPR
jgi:hypothetical protein